MSKGCSTAIGVSLFLIIGLFIAAKWMLQQAFGPVHRTVELPLSGGRKLIGEETYLADFAAVIYAVDFTLIERGDTVELGQAVFNEAGWEEDIRVLETGGWMVLPACDEMYAKILGVHRVNGSRMDTTFSPVHLPEDSMWKNRYEDEVVGDYRVEESDIDSLVDGSLYVTYKYRVGLDSPFVSYRQTIRHELIKETGAFRTAEIYERIPFSW